MGSTAFLNGLVLVVTVIGTVGLLRLSRRLWRIDETSAPLVRILGVYSPVLTWLKYRRLPAAQRRPISWGRVTEWPWPALAELAAIGLWAAWVGRAFLDFDASTWVTGGDWTLNLEGYFPWTWLAQCGPCVMWNGALNGGAPAFVELVAAIVHPVWVAAILLFGVVNASKVAVVIGLATAGWAQWWLAKSFQLSLIVRLWTAALAVVGGHLAGRMAVGLVEEVFSAAACALVIAAAVDLALTGRRSMIALGLTLGFAMLAGQGYMQIGLIACVFPGLIFFVLTSRLQRRPVLKSFILAGVMAVLIAGILWVPLLHFWPNFVKPTADPDFSGMQSLEPLLLNLVLSNPDYYAGLERAGLAFSPAWHANYIGWVPVLLAIVGLRLNPGRRGRFIAFAVTGIVLIYLVGSAALLKWLLPVFPAVMSLRTPSVITSLAVPLILVLAGFGLEALWRWKWPELSLNLPNRVSRGISLRWLLLLPLVWSLSSAYAFGRHWMGVSEHPQPFYPIIGHTSLAGQQWVGTPFGESPLVVVALQSGLKVTNVVRPWVWREHEPPPMHYSWTRDEIDPAAPGYISSQYGLNEIVLADVNYAAVTTSAGVVPCQANALGGNIDVVCDVPEAGLLTVAENTWSGWSVRIDGRRAALHAGRWLSTSAPAGQHRFEFRYRPWDVPVGLLLSLIGLGLAAYLWRRPAGARASSPLGGSGLSPAT